MDSTVRLYRAFEALPASLAASRERSCFDIDPPVPYLTLPPFRRDQGYAVRGRRAPSFRLAGSVLTALALCLGGCAAPTAGPARTQGIETAPEQSQPGRVHALPAPAQPLPEELLLDVGIRPFDMPAANPAAAELRRTEGAYLAAGLRTALQATSDHWGAVRVVSRPSAAIDLAVVARVQQSDGETLALQVRATDARGVQWLDKRYRGTAAAAAYSSGDEPFAAVHAAIASDLARRLLATPHDELRSIRAVAELRFADGLAPGAFAGYLQEDGGVLATRRLPAAEDPLLGHTRQFRSREHLLIDTVDEYFTHFEHRVRQRYADWRRSDHDSAATRRGLLAEAEARELLGAIHVLSGSASGGDRAARRGALRHLIDGAGLLSAAARRRQDAAAEATAAQREATVAGAEMLPATLALENSAATLAGRFATEYAQAQQALSALHLAATGESLPQRQLSRPRPRPLPRPDHFAAIPQRSAETTPHNQAAEAGDTPPGRQLPPVDAELDKEVATVVRFVDDGRLDAAFGVLGELVDEGRAAAHNGRERALVWSALAFAHYRNGDLASASAALEAVLAEGADISKGRLAAASFGLARLRFEREEDALAWQAMRSGLRATAMQQAACAAVCSPDARARLAEAAQQAANGGHCAARRGLGGRAKPLDARFRRQLDLVRGRIDDGQPDAALATIDRLLREYPKGPERSLLWRYKASAHSALGDAAQAIQAYEKMLEGPGFVPPGAESRALDDLAHLHLAQGNYRRSLCYQRLWLHQQKFPRRVCAAACPQREPSGLAVQDRH